MEHKNINQQLEAISNALQQFKSGASIEEIRAASGLDIELRTLQRRLVTLQEKGLVTTTGRLRSTIYYPVSAATDQITAEPAKDLLPISTEGKEILSFISFPQQQRKPVGYHRDFLESYRPNVDSYLSSEETDKLLIIGKAERSDQPAGTYAREILNRLLIDLSWNSSRLEGNTYSLLDTQRLISAGEAADNKSATEAQMILNHKDAIEFIVNSIDDIGFNRYTILNLHALLSNNLLPDPAQ